MLLLSGPAPARAQADDPAATEAPEKLTTAQAVRLFHKYKYSVILDYGFSGSRHTYDSKGDGKPEATAHLIGSVASNSKDFYFRTQHGAHFCAAMAVSADGKNISLRPLTDRSANKGHLRLSAQDRAMDIGSVSFFANPKGKKC